MFLYQSRLDDKQFKRVRTNSVKTGTKGAGGKQRKWPKVLLFIGGLSQSEKHV